VLSARFVTIRVVWNTIHVSILEGSIDQRLLKIKKVTNLHDAEPLLVDQNRDLSLDILRD